MVIMASGIARGGHEGVAEDGSYRLTLRHTALFISSFFYRTSLLQSIDTCQNNISTDQYHMNIYCRLKVRSHCGHVFFLSQSLTKCWFFQVWSEFGHSISRTSFRRVLRLYADTSLYSHVLVSLFSARIALLLLYPFLFSPMCMYVAMVA